MKLTDPDKNLKWEKDMNRMRSVKERNGPSKRESLCWSVEYS